MNGPVSPFRVREALSYISADCDRAAWARILAGVKDELGDAGEEIAREWSMTAPDRFNAQEFKSTWRSLKRGGGVTIGTVLFEAKQGGFKVNGDGARIDASEIDRYKKEHAEAAEKARAERKREADDAAKLASEIWESSSPAPERHSYLHRKGVPSCGLRIYSGPKLTINGVDCAGALIMPLRTSDGTVQTLEFIGASGDKRFLPRGIYGGCYFAIGQPGDVIVVCEGYATGASIHKATGYPVRVAAAAGNLERVARAIREKAPAAKIILAADADATGTGQGKAQQAARAIGGYVAKPDQGKDWNDVHREQGVDAVKHGIEAARAIDNAGPSTPVVQRAEYRVELVAASDIKPEPIEWLWHGWLAAGKLHIIAGAPEAGKTSIALALAASLTTGGRWPDGTKAAPAEVVIWSGEDAIGDTLIPRLLAVGADMKRVRFVRRVEDAQGTRPFDPARDMADLQDALGDGGAKLLILDPIVSAVAGDSHENAKVRRALQPVVDLAEGVNCAVLGVSHFSKGTAGRDPVERVTGSVAFGALPRLVFAAAKLPEEEGGGRMFIRAKSNIGVSGGGFAYSLETCDLGSGIATSRLLWGASLAGNARTLLAQADAVESSEHGSIADAKEFLAGLLSDGPVQAKQIERDADGAGHAWRTVQEAARRLGVERRKVGMREGWTWALPTSTKMHEAPKMHEGANPQALHLHASSGAPAPSETPSTADEKERF